MAVRRSEYPGGKGSRNRRYFEGEVVASIPTKIRGEGVPPLAPGSNVPAEAH